LGFLLLAIVLIISIFYINNSKVSAQENLNIDAIAVRVLSNPDNYSALRWYRERGYTGSPQSLIVDGYEAIRDQRTVFVNAANVSGSTFFTNIYLISYNQDAQRVTQDIFSKILSRWKFNTNLIIPGNCNKSAEINCLTDSQCPLGEYCLSDKAKVTRDTRRLADLADIRTELEAYAKTRGYYPKLEAGSYLRGRSISTWPSWRDKFSTDLNYNLPLDPINKLGDCGGFNFNKITCWDEMVMQFPGGDPASGLPADSHVYVYSITPDGASFDVCAVMESGYDISGNCSFGAASNNPPQIVNSSFPDACQGEEYNAYIEAYDADSDELSWSFNGSWGAVLEDIPGFPNKKRIYAASAGSIGIYTFQVGVNDGRGGSANGNYTVSSVNCVSPCTVNCSTGPGCRSSLTNGEVAGSECCGNGYCYDCFPGFTWNGSICEVNCTPNCSTGPGCRFSLAYGHVVAGECCGNGSCYDCVSGYSWDGSVCRQDCVPTCSTEPGCRTGLTNGQIVAGECCGAGSCYKCISPSIWNGSVCFLPCVPDCSTGPNCRNSLNNGQIVAGECCGVGSCYNCLPGYSWDGSICQPNCVISCVSPFGCLNSAPANSQIVPGECCSTGSCYGCADGYSWDGSICQPNCVPDCSTGPGCRNSLDNGEIVTGECCGVGNCYDCAAGYTWNGSSCQLDCVINCVSPFGCLNSAPANSQIVPGECCGTGECYGCADGYQWNGSSCELISTCGVYFQGALIGSPTALSFYEPFVVSPYDDWVADGDYPNSSTALTKSNGVATFDAIAIDVNVRFEMWDGQNFSGTKVIDVVGPVVINNVYWVGMGIYNDPYTLANNFGLSPAIWPDCQFSSDNMWGWGDSGSFKITCL